MAGLADNVARAGVERAMRKRGWLTGSSGLREAWVVSLLVLSVNDVDCAQREQGGRLIQRLARRLSGDAPTLLALTDLHLVLHTTMTMYPAASATIAIARHSGSTVELLWLSPKRPDVEGYAERVPQGSLELDRLDVFHVRVDAHNEEAAHEIVECVVEMRERGLSHATPKARADLERLIREANEIPFN